ncbi:MAG: YicC/YloC family endoribonuclease [Spirochaetaceae bacterium]
MISMTGYGYREYRDERVQLLTEIKSYNNRYLDTVLNAPPFLSPLEPLVKDFIRNRVYRGRVEIYLRVKELEEDISIHLDEAAAKKYADTLRRLTESVGIEEEPKIGHFLNLEGIITQVKNRDLEWFEKIVLEELEEAYKEFDRGRRREGEKTEEDIKRLLSRVESELLSIERQAGTLEARIKENLEKRFKELLDEKLDHNRLYQETAVMLMKYGIEEETVRMHSHLSQFRELLSEEGVVGKKLDFVSQELNREINTIGSKSTVAEINRSVVEIKDSLEKIREQLRNVE